MAELSSTLLYIAFILYLIGTFFLAVPSVTKEERMKKRIDGRD